MQKFIYNLVLEPGTDEAAFLSGPAAGMQVKSNLDMFDGLLCMLLTEEEANQLAANDSVKEIMLEPKAVPTYYPSLTLTNPAHLITNTTPSLSGPGSQYAGTHFYHCGEQGGTNASGPVGFFTSSGEDASIPGETITQKYAGQYVDIVAIEAGGFFALTTYDDYVDHPDFSHTVQTATAAGLIFTHNLTATVDSGPLNYLISGDTKNSLRNNTTLTNSADPFLYIRPGDTLNITNNANSDDAIEIVEYVISFPTSSYVQVQGVTNQGAFDGATISWTPTAADIGRTFYYRSQRDGGSVSVRGIIRVQNHESRFKETDWSDYDSGASDAVNNQATNGTDYFTAHAIGVLSAAGGTYCGWAKVSSLRVIYLDDGITTAYNAVLQFHNNKPVNPITGLRNATIVTGAYGFPSYAYDGAIPIDNITRINAYDVDGNLTQINKPVGGWGTDFTPFTDNLLIPRLITDPADSVRKWCITYGLNSRYTPIDTAMNTYNSTGGIYHFKSAGNFGNVAVGPSDPRWNTNIENTGTYIEFTVDTTIESYDTLNPSTATSSTTRYPLRNFENGADNMITVAATQNSTINPLLDDYSSRGPMVDIAGTGAYTWTCYPSNSYTDGKWGYFSGTSCAAPQAAGVAAVIVTNYLTQRGVYPSISKLKEIMKKHAKPLAGEPTIDWSNVPSPADYPQNRLYSSGDVYSMKNNDAVNGGIDLSDLHGTPAERAFVPWGIYMGTGQYIADPRGPSYGKRPSSGQMYPRRKIRVGA